jgi:hypothetical protein
MWADGGGFTGLLWMPFIERWHMPIEIGEREREIFEDCGSAGSMLRQGSMGFPIVG